MRIFPIKLSLIASILILSINSCDTREGCTNPEASNYDSNAILDDGSCTYDRDWLIGTYTNNDVCTSGTYDYTNNITAAPDSRDVLINNFGDFPENITITARISGEDITINDTQNGIEIVGTGTINNGNGTITINYTATSNGGTPDVCTLVAVLQ